MARYRKVDVRVWVDDKFRRLTPLRPSGQALWLYLITNPNTTNIPGLYRAGELAMSEELGWPREAFREAFAEVFAEGLVQADWSARVVWLPGGGKYNQPESPNVVKSWATAWDEIPDCQLKGKAYQTLKAFTEGLGQAFGEAFVKTCRKPSAKTCPNPDPDQDQEPEGEPARDPMHGAAEHVARTAVPAPGPTVVAGNGQKAGRPTAHDVLEWFALAWRDEYKRFWTRDRDAPACARALLEEQIAELEPAEAALAYGDIRRRMGVYLALKEPGLVKQCHPFRWFCDRFNSLAATSEQLKGNGGHTRKQFTGVEPR